MTYAPFTMEGAERQSRFLITCDHATNLVPPDLGGTLGLPEEDMARRARWTTSAWGLMPWR